MSHNKVKIGSAIPDRASELSVALGDLNNVSESTLQNGDYLIYNSTTSQWTNTTPSAVYAGVIFIGEELLKIIAIQMQVELLLVMILSFMQVVLQIRFQGQLLQAHQIG